MGNIHKQNDKEVTIVMYSDIKEFKDLSKDNVKIEITACGDLTHHVIEGIVSELKTIQKDNTQFVDI